METIANWLLAGIFGRTDMKYQRGPHRIGICLLHTAFARWFLGKPRDRITEWVKLSYPIEMGNIPSTSAKHSLTLSWIHSRCSPFSPTLCLSTFHKLNFMTSLIGSLSALPLCNPRTTILSALTFQVLLGISRISDEDPLKKLSPFSLFMLRSLSLLMHFGL